MASVLDAFHPAVRAWFKAHFAAPSRAQELGWPIIAAAAPENGAPGHDVLLCAPTGSGKTLAAFMWSIDRLVADGGRGVLPDEVSVLYISPLKALANDIRLNLDEPLSGVQQAARELGITLSEVRAGLRTGDTPAHQRSAMLRRPPHILVTTPESAFILLTSPRFRTRLGAVRYVIVDELHALAGNKRGAHLMLTLERLERMVRAGGAPRPVRIGLSATLNPIERLAEFLAGGEVDPAGARRPRPVQIVRADDRARAMDIKVIAPGPELGPLATHQHWEAMYDEAARLIRAHRTTLIFTLSRRWAERVALNLQKRLGADAVMAHHGSLARKERHEAEERLKRGELKAIVATASLELGIDVGAVELVCQLDSPKSISAAIQRIGRSGHSLFATPRGRFFALTIDDLLECAAAVRAIGRGVLDEAELPGGCLDVAAQQIIAIAAEEEEISEAELIRLIRGAHTFAALDPAALRVLLSELGTELPERIRGAAPRILYDRAGGRIRARRGARLAAITSGGTIPESGNYDVVIESSGRKVGDVEEDFAQESSRGDVFALGSMPWRIERISRGRLMVEPAPGMAPTLPFWQTEAAGRSPALSAELSALKRDIAAAAHAAGEGDRGAAAAAAMLIRECALDERPAAQAVSYVLRGEQALGAIPDRNTLVVERFFDGLGGTQIVIHSPLGIRLNRGLGLALRKRLCQSFDFEIQASAIDDGVLLALNSRHSFPLEQVLAMLNPRTARGVLVQALLDAPMFEVRFRHVASRALMVMRSLNGRKVPAWIQRLRSQELMTALFPARNACFENRPPAIEVPTHFAVAETVRECLEETADLPRMVKLLGGIEDGSVRVLTTDALSPSVFAQRLLLAWDYSFLDDGERANRRSRTVTMNRGMAEEVMRKEDLSALLADDAVETAVSEVQGRAPARRARNRDELYEIIRAHGALRRDELAERAAGDLKVMLEELRGEARLLLIRTDCAGAELMCAAEDAPLFACVYPGALLAGAAAIPSGTLDPAAARQELVRRLMRTSGPATVSHVAARLKFEPSQADAALAALEAEGKVFRGHFTSASHEQWCDRYNLERIHRLTLGRIRAEIEPCGDEQFAAFRMRWFHIGGAGLNPPGTAAVQLDNLAAVLEQLSGMAFSPQFWERSILPARVKTYRSEHLDLLCTSGAVAWAAIAPGGRPEKPGEGDAAGQDSTQGKALAPSLVTFVNRSQIPLLIRAGAEPDDPRDRAVYEALCAGGAQYFDEISDRAGLSERDALAALWRLARAVRVSNDSFAPLRLLDSTTGARWAPVPAARPLTRRDAALRARLKSSMAGRWTALGAGREADSNPDAAREIALLLLRRNGILAREMLGLETLTLSWSELSFALRRLEYAGTIRRGYFVRALSGEQYALPEAVEMLRAAREINLAREAPTVLSAADPANPWGAMLPGCGIARDATNLIVIRAGRLMFGLAGEALTALGAAATDDDAFSAATAALIAMRRRMVIRQIDGAPALNSPRVGLMAAFGFHSDGRALVYDGLPGPAPARAATTR